MEGREEPEELAGGLESAQEPDRLVRTDEGKVQMSLRPSTARRRESLDLAVKIEKNMTPHRASAVTAPGKVRAAKSANLDDSRNQSGFPVDE